MEKFYTIVILILIIIGIERMTLPPTSPVMVADAQAYGVTHTKEIPPNSFKQDGCTLFPDSILWSNFSQACLEHDIAYWYGGTEEERKVADQNFKSAVADSGKAGYVLQVPIYLGVRLFSDTWLTKLFDANWGFGWNE